MERLQFITQSTDTYNHVEAAKLALAGGCRWIQLRMKHTEYEPLKRTAQQVLSLCRDYGAKFIIDDQVELVHEIQADGVHLGNNDMPVSEARAFLGPRYIIGGTANTFEDIAAHHKAGADYIGCGPFRFTRTKENLSPILGLEGYRSIILQMKEKNIHLPLVAIGGITADDIPPLLHLGVTGIALSGAILHTTDPISETRKILQLIQP